MKAALCMMQYDYGEPSRGFSYEYINIFLPMKKILGETNVILFDFYAEFRKSGKAAMNEKLKDFINSEHPDFTLFCLFENELDEQILLSLKEKTVTAAYFFDDPWRKEYARYWRNYFHYSTTPDYYSHLQYLSEGKSNIIYAPFGYNSDIYKKIDIEKKYDVSFVGGYNPYRKWALDFLRNKGVKVSVFGRGWGKSWLSQEEMVNVFNSSKINLNLSNSISYDYRYIVSSILSPKDIKQLLLLKKNKEQVKGRHFEINGCGGFQLSYFVPGLNLMYEIDKEIAVYEDIDSLPDEINFYLNNPGVRDEAARAGYERSLKDHKAENYLSDLIRQIMK
jgi:spore maturation protein CgeB